MTPSELKSAREVRGLSQEALARLLGVTTSAVSKWESAARPISAFASLAIPLILADAAKPRPRKSKGI